MRVESTWSPQVHSDVFFFHYRLPDWAIKDRAPLPNLSIARIPPPLVSLFGEGRTMAKRGEASSSVAMRLISSGERAGSSRHGCTDCMQWRSRESVLARTISFHIWICRFGLCSLAPTEKRASGRVSERRWRWTWEPVGAYSTACMGVLRPQATPVKRLHSRWRHAWAPPLPSLPHPPRPIDGRNLLDVARRRADALRVPHWVRPRSDMPVCGREREIKRVQTRSLLLRIANTIRELAP